LRLLNVAPLRLRRRALREAPGGALATAGDSFTSSELTLGMEWEGAEEVLQVKSGEG
jgi:hypothetical protein